MKVSDAMKSRISCRAYLKKPVPRDLVESILQEARLSPSGGNLQPWIVHALSGDVLDILVSAIRPHYDKLPMGQGSEYNIYPPNLKEPYRSRRYKGGEDLYESVDIKRGERSARMELFARNYAFFGAPVGLLFALDRTMGAPQWCDLGIFLQSIMLLAREQGLHTCAQEAWAIWYPIVAEQIEIPDEQIVFCGMALGYMDEEHPINNFRTERAKLSDIANFSGFDND